MASAIAQVQPHATIVPSVAIAAVCAEVHDATRVIDLSDELIDTLEAFVAFDLPMGMSLCEWLVLQALDPSDRPLTVGQLKALYAA
ncbi:hypothetical protein ABIE56_003225 [Luteibacter sp. 621]|jgi:hypothetical protein|uniref:hypothetical protein n=1 Tax=Luteibacter sp. 621 TaxID=3373916 RepID=UPI003D21ED78